MGSGFYAQLLWLIPAFPLLGFIATGLMSLIGARSAQGPSRKMAGTIAVLMPVCSFIVTLICAVQIAGVGIGSLPLLKSSGWEWFGGSDWSFSVGLLFDRLSALMLAFITGIGSLIVLYSTGYMAEDRGYARFMAYLNLFLFSMIMLVLADSLPLTFLGWEGVGLCSYLLIGFWHKDHTNNDAARKAFIVNRIGDLGFLLGAFCLIALMGQLDLSYGGIAAFCKEVPAEVMHEHSGLLFATCLFLFIGCAGKSAQIPLMIWLPDAMAGPTPVSALIHAATMVTSGVFLLARLSELYAWSHEIQILIGFVAAGTALWAAIAGLFQWDIKKVLAYSTISQLGYMFIACAVNSYDAALFHVFTHAFFKAALFLGAGSVIHALHHEQDMRKMGGLKKVLPMTHGAMALGWWSIIGLPLGAAFFSKDLILEHVYHHGGINVFFYLIGLITAVITAVYMSRLMYYTFWSPSRMDTHTAKHAHEVPLVMWLPVVVLAIGALCAGTLWFGFINKPGLFEEWLYPVLRDSQWIADGRQGAAPGLVPAASATDPLAAMESASQSQVEVNMEAVLFALISVIAATVGWLLARAWFRKGPKEADVASMAPVSGFGAMWTWGFDRFYNAAVVIPLKGVECIMAYVVDRGVSAVVAGVATVVDVLGQGYRSFQRAHLRSSLALSLLGVVIVLVYVVSDLLRKGA